LKRKSKNNIKIKSELGDGSYDNTRISNIYKRKRIKPSIKKRMYGRRWMISETVFSSIKRIFGGHVSATRFQHGKRDDFKSVFV
jgi:hypothetical protein